MRVSYSVRVDQKGVISRQEGIFRVNCMDCLDRTNVIQSLLARRSLQSQLQVNTTFNLVISVPLKRFNFDIRHVFSAYQMDP